MSLIALSSNKQRPTFSKYGKALDNFFMIFQPDNSKLLHVEPSAEILLELEQRALQFNMKVQNAKELQGTSTFRAISREKGSSYFTKHEGANRSYNPKYEFIKKKPVTYTIPKSLKDAKDKTKPSMRPITAKARYCREKNIDNNEVIEEKSEENIEGNNESMKNINENTEGNYQENGKKLDNVKNLNEKKNMKERAFSAKTNISNTSRKFVRNVFACVNFEKQTERKPFNFVSTCVNEHNFENFEMKRHTGKKILDFKQYLNRKTYLCEDAKFDLPDKFYLNNFNWNKIYPQKSKCFIHFDRFREKNNKNLETKNFINSSVDVKDLPDMYQHLAHFQRLPSPNFQKILGRNEAKILKERVANSSGFRPKSAAYGRYEVKLLEKK